LREIFITFFDTSKVDKGSSDMEKLLVSMETRETSVNPFYVEPDETGEADASVLMTGRDSSRFGNIMRYSSMDDPMNANGSPS